VNDAAERVVIAAITAAGHPEPIDLDAPWRAQEIDSLDLLDVVLASERSMGCVVPDEVALRLFTPRDLVNALMALSPRPRSVPIVPDERIAVPVGTRGAVAAGREKPAAVPRQR
jgi:acyl carrier protein